MWKWFLKKVLLGKTSKSMGEARQGGEKTNKNAISAKWPSLGEAATWLHQASLECRLHLRVILPRATYLPFTPLYCTKPTLAKSHPEQTPGTSSSLHRPLNIASLLNRVIGTSCWKQNYNKPRVGFSEGVKDMWGNLGIDNCGAIIGDFSFCM